MPKGPRGEKRPGDVIGNSVHIVRIATGEMEDVKVTPDFDRLWLMGGLAAMIDAWDEAQPRQKPGRKPKEVANWPSVMSS